MNCKDPISEGGQAGTWLRRKLLFASVMAWVPVLCGVRAWAQPVSKQVRDANVTVLAMATRRSSFPAAS